MDSESGESFESMSLDTQSSTSVDTQSSTQSSKICSASEKSLSYSESCADRLPMEDDEDKMNIVEYNFSFFEKLLAVFSFTVQYNLPYTAVDQMLQLMDLWSGTAPDYKELESVYQMRRYLDRNMLRPQIHYLCPSSNCSGSYLEESVPNNCTEEDCNEPLVIEDLRKKGQYFLYTPLSKQIKQILEIKEMEEIMSNYLDGAVHQGMQCYPNSLKNIFSSKR